MILGPKKLLELVKGVNLVENLDERELTNPEGAGFDVRLGEVYSISGVGFLGIGERKTPDENLIAKYEATRKQKITFLKDKYYLVKTIEKVNLPDNLTLHIYPRSTLFRSGISLLVTQGAPGYSGHLVFGMTNLAETSVEIELGARIAHIQFASVEGGGSSYRGQWQGGRVSAKKKEKQV